MPSSPFCHGDQAADRLNSELRRQGKAEGKVGSAVHQLASGSQHGEMERVHKLELPQFLKEGLITSSPAANTANPDICPGRNATAVTGCSRSRMCATCVTAAPGPSLFGCRVQTLMLLSREHVAKAAWWCSDGTQEAPHKIRS